MIVENPSLATATDVVVQRFTRDGWSAPVVLEVDLEVDLVLHDLPVLDLGRGLHHLDLADVAHRSRRGGDRLARGVAPGRGAGADHLPDDEDAHADSLRSLLARLHEPRGRV